MSRVRKFGRLNADSIMGESSGEMPLLNIGMLQDIPTATFVKGSKGETVIFGGVDLSTAFTGPGNSYKSTLAMYMFLTLLDRYADLGSIYDSEINMKSQRILNLAKHMDIHKYLETSFSDVIKLQSKTNMYADEWFNNFKKLCEENEKSKHITFAGTNVTMPPVLTTLLDSITEAEPKIANDMLNKAKVEDSSTNTYFMRTGLFKTKMVGEIPMYCFKGNNRFILTAHTGQKLGIGENKYSKPDKMLKELKDDEIIKGVSSKFSFLISTVYKNSGASVLKNQSTKLPDYPTADGNMYAVDLSTVTTKILRCKSGATGLLFPIVVSQTEGVLNSLTEFNYIKKKDFHPEVGGDWGISGSVQHYHMDFLPDVSLSRTKIRDLIVSNSRLRRAINLSSELLQLSTYHGSVYQVKPTNVIYGDIKNLGYDWDEILDTRGWGHPDNYNVKELGKYLSVVDLLNRSNGDYIPFWLDKEQTKTVKENIKKMKELKDVKS